MRRATRLVVLSFILAITATLFGAFGVRAQDESTLVIGFEQEAPNLRPLNNHTYGGLFETFYVRDLWEYNVDRQPVAVMASELPTEENGRVVVTEEGNTAVTISLREGLFWSDGNPITAADCEASHTIRHDPSTSSLINRAGYPNVVLSFERDPEDELTFTITYAGIFPDYLAADEKPECRYAAHVINPIIEAGNQLEDSPYFLAGEDHGGFRAVSYGPYALLEWNIGSDAVFVRNPYWDGQAPAWDRIVIPFITDSTQMRNALTQGEIDIAYNFSEDQIAAYGEIAGVETFGIPSVYADALWVRSGANGNSDNHGGNALEDPRVRQALAHAIDRLALAEELVGPGTVVPKSWYPEGFQPDDLPFLEYDPDLARQLLDEAGWVQTGAPLVDGGDGVRAKDGIELTNLRLVSTPNELRNNYQIFIQDYLAEIGIGVDVEIIPATNLFAGYADNGTLTNYQWDLAVFANSAKALTPLGDPNSYRCSGIPSPENPDGFNPWQFCNPRYDEVDELLAVTPPGDERTALSQEAVRLHVAGDFWHGLRLRATWFAINSEVVDPASVAAYVGNLDSNWFNQVEYWEASS